MWDSLDKTLVEVLRMTWPMIFISVVLIASVRICYLVKHKEEFVFYKEILLLTFMIYILCLFQVVTMGDINTSGGNNLVPFKEILRYDFGGRLFVKNIIGNVIMFIPYGFFASIYADIKKPTSAVAIISLASISIESTQLLIGRIFDIDDIILNLVGGMIGFCLYLFLDKLASISPNIFKSQLFLNIVTVVLLGLTIGYMIWRL